MVPRGVDIRWFLEAFITNVFGGRQLKIFVHKTIM
jgi:hypothetical protein